MCNAITTAAEQLVAWCDAHPDSYPPTVLHVTDGESTDGDPEGLAQQLQQISTSDGNVLLFNLHVSTSGGDPVKFPSSDVGLSDNYAKLLFRMSSPLPMHLHKVAEEKGINATMESRGFVLTVISPKLSTSSISVLGQLSCADHDIPNPLRRDGSQAPRCAR